MYNIKISASFKLKGSVMYSEKDKNGEPIHYDTNTVNFYDTETNKTKTVKLKTSRCKPCTQTISMSKEAYQYMMSTPVGDMSANHWKQMSENQRIAEHLKETQHDLGAISFEFTIFND